jgi:hypothetical protein
MKKIIFKILLMLAVLMPVSAVAGVSVHVSIPLPPPIAFPAPPDLVVIPETDVYAVPDVADDIFFYGGWWWRPWDGRWYRSHYYDRGWAHYRGVPSFHRNIHPGWRENYRNHEWKGHQWEQQRVPHRDLQRNWRSWERNRQWERNSWGVQGLPSKDKKYRRDVRKRGDVQAGPHQSEPRQGHQPGPGPAHER